MLYVGISFGKNIKKSYFLRKMCVFNIFFVPLHLGNNKFEIYLFKL